MITIKNQIEIDKMKQASSVLASAILMLKKATKVGINCLELDYLFEEFITSHGCKSNFKGYGGFPKTICISINDQLIHGIPQDRIIEDGDIVSIDTGCSYEGYHADSAFTMICGLSKDEKYDKLVKVTEESLELAIGLIRPGVRLGTIGHEIQSYVEQNGFHVPRDYVGHGIGTQMHEDPFIPNYGSPNTGIRLQAGMTICIEPMVQIGTHKTKTASDKWTVYSEDHSMAAHFEHTILVTETGSEVLTRCKD